jgi:hypothetical protein
MPSIKARYIKVRMQNNFVSCLENSPLYNKCTKPRALGINFCSIMGYDLSTVGNIEITINEMKRETSSKILGLLFRGQFPNTLSKIATNKEYIEFVKTHLNSMMDLISNPMTSHVIIQILQSFVSFNKELGDWIISK